jgi:hypothetical protein
LGLVFKDVRDDIPKFKSEYRRTNARKKGLGTPKQQSPLTMSPPDIFSNTDAPLKIMSQSRQRPSLPQGVSEQVFSTILEKLSKVVGKQNVSSDDAAGLEKYYDPWSLTSRAELFTPSAAVRPASVDQIQKILQIANEYSIPLWTVSRGKNFG